jgi:hypothetical protein
LYALLALIATQPSVFAAKRRGFLDELLPRHLRMKSGAAALASRKSAAASWRHIAAALAVSSRADDRDIAAAIDRHVTQVEQKFDRDANLKVDRDARR